MKRLKDQVESSVSSVKTQQIFFKRELKLITDGMAQIKRDQYEAAQTALEGNDSLDVIDTHPFDYVNGEQALCLQLVCLAGFPAAAPCGGDESAACLQQRFVGQGVAP